MTTTLQKRGVGFLLGDVDVDTLTTPERLTEEQRMLRQTTRKYVETEVMPRIEELEELKPELLKELLQKTGELGLCMIDIPEEYGGLGLDFISSVQVPEILNWGGGFQVTHSVQTVIGLLPILYFGNEEQKQKWLPKIGSVETVTAYALTEPGSGSDALAAKTTAVETPDGKHWILNGSKQFITNGGLADLFIVFAQVDGRHFSAFIVERDAPGFMVGNEEDKMGIRSSSTTTLFFNDCKIPKENLIGEVGWGGKIALNTLNVGRLKLGVAAVGAAKEALEVAVKYALERKQFGKAIAEFGIIREKIAEMAARVYAGESTMLRTAGTVREAIEAGKAESSGQMAPAMMAALKEFSAECAIEKVHGSEIQAYCTDEAIQIHGGYGFIEEYRPARLYRDARITRLYEGTNEINRMQIGGEVLKRVAAGKLTENGNGHKDFGSLEDIAGVIRNWKTLVLKLATVIQQKLGAGAERKGGDQEVLQRMADLVIAIYGVESAMGRAVQARAANAETADLFESLTRIYAAAVSSIPLRSAREILMLATAGEPAAGELKELETLATPPASNVIAIRRQVAAAIIAREGAWFE